MDTAKPDTVASAPRGHDRSLTVRYFSVLLSAALLFIAGAGLIRFWVADPAFDATLINHAGRQRMLARTASTHAALLVGATSGQGRWMHLSGITDVTDRIAHVQHALKHGDVELGLRGNPSREAGRLLADVDTVLGDVSLGLAALAALDDLAWQTQSLRSPRLQVLVSSLEKLAQSTDSVVQRFEAEALQRAETYAWLEGSLLVVPLLLLLQSLFVFRPLLLRMRAAQGELSATNAQLRSEIHAHKRAEDNRIRMEVAVTQAGKSVLITDPSGRIQYVNSAFEQLSGYSARELLGRTPAVVKSGRHGQEFYRELWDTISNGQVWRGQIVNRRKDGSTWQDEQTISPVRDDAGRIINYIAIKEDVTQRVQLEERLRQAEKLEAIGALAGGIAHDLNNILTPVLGYAELAERHLEKGSKASENLGHVVKAAFRARDLISRILSFSRRESLAEYRPLRPGPQIKEALKLLRATIPRTIKLVQEIDQDLPAVLADASELHSLILNLCINATHAMPSGGELTVALMQTELRGYRTATGATMSGEFVRLTVTDDGLGMDAETLAHIYDPFFTTKPEGKGTGLGLSMVFGIVTRMAGFIEVESRLGQGTVFQLYFPVVADAEAEAVPEATPIRAGALDSILLVDDEPEVLNFATAALSEAGFKVTAVGDARGAVPLLLRADPSFHVLVTDIAMPYVDGWELVRLLRASHPTLPVVLCTGALGPDTRARVGAVHGAVLLTKPYSMRELTAAVARVLDGGALLSLGRRESESA